MKRFFTLMMVASLMLACILPALAEQEGLSANDAIAGVYAYGFVDLEGAKTSAIIVEYTLPIDGASVDE